MAKVIMQSYNRPTMHLIYGKCHDTCMLDVSCMCVENPMTSFSQAFIAGLHGHCPCYDAWQRSTLVVWLLYTLSGPALFYVGMLWRCSCLTRQQCCRSGADRHSNVCTSRAAACRSAAPSGCKLPVQGALCRSLRLRAFGALCRWLCTAICLSC